MVEKGIFTKEGFLEMVKVLDRERKRKRKSEGGKDGLSDQSDECWERRENISIRRRGYFDCLSFSFLGVLWADTWTDGGGSYPYRYIWILTLKRIYAEGLQQIILRICS